MKRGKKKKGLQVTAIHFREDPDRDTEKTPEVPLPSCPFPPIIEKALV